MNHNYIFHSLAELKLYLQNHKVNRDLFINPSSEIVRDKEPTYQEMLDGIGKKSNIENFNIFMENFRKISSKYSTSRISDYKTVKSFYGSRVSVPDYLSGDPRCMYRTVYIEDKEVIDVYVNLACPALLNKQIFENKGIVVLSLIKLLEDLGYLVNVHSFFLAKEMDAKGAVEFFYANIILKSINERLDINKCYTPFCDINFLRKILVRLIETTKFEISYWSKTYGTSVTNEEIKQYLKFEDNAIIIPSLKIEDKNKIDILDYANFLFEEINLDKFINVKKR